MIAVHKNHNQAMRLINHLKKDFDLYVHIDKKSKLNIKSFDNVKVYKKFRVQHAGISQVITTLFLIEEAFKNNYDRFVFISGQDIPLKSNKEIINFFEENKNKEFISFEDITNNESCFNEMSYRLNTYNFGLWYRKLLSRKVRVSISNISFLKRETPNNIYYGSSWINLTKESINYILDYITKNKKYLDRFKFTWGADEFFFQSILLNSPFKEQCVNNCLRYLIWQGGVPITFKSEHYDMIKNNINDNLFARKFDENIDTNIIDMLYNDI